MAAVSVDTRSILLVLLVAGALVGGGYLLNPSFMNTMFENKQGFADMPSKLSTNSVGSAQANTGSAMNMSGSAQRNAVMANPSVASPPSNSATGTNMPKAEGYADLSTFEGPSSFGNAEAPAGCYPRDQLTPSELLPKDPNSVWAQQNPMGTGSLKGKNFLSAGALIGVNTVGQSLRNANYQMRSEPPNPQVAVSVFNQTTIEPDVNRRTLEIN
jgi:hypothetical protein